MQNNYKPFSIEAERSIIGGLIFDPSLWYEMQSIITVDDLYSGMHRIVFTHISLILASNNLLDLTTLSASLSENTKFHNSFEYLVKIMNTTPSSRHIMAYVKIVVEHSRMRRLLEGMENVIDKIKRKEEETVDELISTIQLDLYKTFESLNALNKDSYKLSDFLHTEFEDFYAHFDKQREKSLSTGYADLDSLITGLIPGNFYIVAGRPSMGKTSFALSLIENIYRSNPDTAILMFSLEMSTTDIFLRLLSSGSGVPYSVLNKGENLSSFNLAKAKDCYNMLREANIYIDECASLTPSQLMAKARKIYTHTSGKLGLIIVDYLQLMSSGSNKPGMNRVQEVSDISRTLKSIARELGLPVVAVSQLNRNVDERPDKRPMLSDLRESGALEQDADTVIFIYRDEIYNKDTLDKGIAEIIIGKQRNGPIGKILTQFHGYLACFRPMEYKQKTSHNSGNNTSLSSAEKTFEELFE